MPAIDSQVFNKRMLAFLFVLGVSIFYEGHALPLKDRSDDSSSNAGSPYLLQRPLQEATDLKQGREHLGSIQEGRCPPGLWCTRSAEPQSPAENAEEHIRAHQDEKDEEKHLLKESDEESARTECLPGADCKKTQAIHKVIETSRRCPFGLWCQSNANENGRDFDMKMDGLYPTEEMSLQQEKNLRGEIRSNAREIDETQSADGDCPPGLWCKRNGHIIQPGNYRESTDLTTQSICPWDLWCSKKRSFGLYNSRVISRCPPGLWCRRSTELPDWPSPNCMLSPNNPWCKVRAYVDAADAMAKRRETARGCPPGLWCKH